MSRALAFADSDSRQYEIAMSEFPSLAHALIRVDISLTSSFVLKNFRMYRSPRTSSWLPCCARLIIIAVTSFDISSSESSINVLSYGILVSLRISIAPGPEPVTPGMYGDVDHSNALLRGLVAG